LIRGKDFMVALAPRLNGSKGAGFEGTRPETCTNESLVISIKGIL